MENENRKYRNNNPFLDDLLQFFNLLKLKIDFIKKRVSKWMPNDCLTAIYQT
ncbi:hypothetical protein ADICYQ_4955 [Cyclobacterium qasimii M12-11B]|uniref:Uncharacterized protein n=1 Tax=Cyclobacterium qasimii M12-11B TaxID=641524 RepID=S7V7V3_9BACT|nr:hypothetical protein ADICYQ_4955 [Cyclobacterium qasimii M12-11B]